jgi:hypothetical protein
MESLPSSLGEKLILLAAGAALTGFLVPYIKSRLDDASATRKQLLDATLARHAELFGAQVKLLTDFSDTGWRFLFGAFKVSYAFAWEDDDSQNEVTSTYAPLSWELLTAIRATISKATRLLSTASLNRLLATYDWLIAFDDELANMLEKEATNAQWEEFHRRRFPEAAGVMDHAIAALANELKLTAPTAPIGKLSATSQGMSSSGDG